MLNTSARINHKKTMILGEEKLTFHIEYGNGQLFTFKNKELHIYATPGYEKIEGVSVEILKNDELVFDTIIEEKITTWKEYLSAVTKAIKKYKKII